MSRQNYRYKALYDLFDSAVTVTPWLKIAMAELDKRDPVDAMRDVEQLCEHLESLSSASESERALYVARFHADKKASFWLKKALSDLAQIDRDKAARDVDLLSELAEVRLQCVLEAGAEVSFNLNGLNER